MKVGKLQEPKTPSNGMKPQNQNRFGNYDNFNPPGNQRSYTGGKQSDMKQSLDPLNSD